nr:hypothetical protein [Tanacetum cinerariifolium]
MVDDDDETSKDKEIDKLMALISLSFKKIYKPTNNNLRTSSNTKQADWKDDTDDESDDQELEAHYMYMAKIQECLNEEMIVVQEQIDAQVAKELEEQQEKEYMRMNEQIARDAEVARIHAEEELQGMIDSLDQSNETIAKYLQEYQDFASELPLEKMIELISDLKREYYMAVIKSNLGWRFKNFKVKVVVTARRLEMPLPEVCTAIEEKKKKLPVKDRWQLH